VASGYSATPRLKKLGIVPGVSWDVDAAPDGWGFETDPDASSRAARDEPADVVLAFVKAAVELEPAIARLERRVFPAGALWIAWPRKAGGHVSDVSENDIRDTALGRGLVDVKVAAIDEDWSGLKLVWRRENR
jgi:hypothetical protein